MTQQDHANAIYEAINTAVNALDDVLPRVQNQVMQDIEKLLTQFEVDVNGNIKSNVANLRKVAAIRSKITRVIDENELYKTHIAQYLDTFDDINALQKVYFDAVFDGFETTAVLKELQTQTIAATANSLTNAGIAVNIIDPVQDILRKNVTTGVPFFDLAKQLREFIAGDAENLGHIDKYVKQITTDALNQYAAQYMEVVSDDLKLEWFEYTAPLIETSRDLCIALKRKRFYHKREIPSIVKGQFIQFKEVGGTIYSKTKLPHGMVPGTNAENFNVYRGGYNCNHQPIPIPESRVPRKTRIEVYNKYDLRHKNGVRVAA